MSVLKTTDASHLDWVTLDQGSIEVIIGLFDHERIHPQTLEFKIRLGVEKENIWQAGRLKDLNRSIDYGGIHDLVSWILIQGQFFLLESALVTLFRALFRVSQLRQLGSLDERQAPLHYLSICLRKPHILNQVTPCIELHRSQEWMNCYDDPLRLKESHTLTDQIHRRLKSVEDPSILKVLDHPFIHLESLICLDECLLCLLESRMAHEISLPTDSSILNFYPVLGEWTQSESAWKGKGGWGILSIRSTST